jgi:hypothetical protein
MEATQRWLNAVNRIELNAEKNADEVCTFLRESFPGVLKGRLHSPALRCGEGFWEVFLWCRPALSQCRIGK